MDQADFELGGSGSGNLHGKVLNFPLFRALAEKYWRFVINVRIQPNPRRRRTEIRPKNRGRARGAGVGLR